MLMSTTMLSMPGMERTIVVTMRRSSGRPRRAAGSAQPREAGDDGEGADGRNEGEDDDGEVEEVPSVAEVAVDVRRDTEDLQGRLSDEDPEHDPLA